VSGAANVACETVEFAVVKVLFVCSRNRRRSPTAEQVFSAYPNLECRSAGTEADAESPLAAEDVAWADLVVAMERRHKRWVAEHFHQELQGKRLLCLGIPDHYRFMDPELVRLLEAKLWHLLPEARAAERR
jgi:predicted protein tyrosine phosphatase